MVSQSAPRRSPIPHCSPLQNPNSRFYWIVNNPQVHLTSPGLHTACTNHGILWLYSMEVTESASLYLRIRSQTAQKPDKYLARLWVVLDQIIKFPEIIISQSQVQKTFPILVQASCRLLFCPFVFNVISNKEILKNMWKFLRQFVFVINR